MSTTKTDVRISTTSGHLTAREKQIIAAALQNKWRTVKSARIRVWLEKIGGELQATTVKNYTDEWGRKLQSRSRATFTTNADTAWLAGGALI